VSRQQPGELRQGKVGVGQLGAGTSKVSGTSKGGTLDMVACNTVLGWAWDANQPNTAIDVDLFDGGVLLAGTGAT
jgi:hypothetical protein